MYTPWKALALVLALTAAGSHNLQAGERTALFDGKTLDGWTVRTCEAVIDNGELLIKDGNGLVQSEKMYGDFILEFECIALADDNWDSGVYFRYDSVPKGRPWPGRYQVNMRKGQEGNVGRLADARSKDLVKPKSWNRFKLTVQGTKATMEINGKPAWSADGLEGPAKGYIGIQAEVPNGGQYRFRNIWITEQ